MVTMMMMQPKSEPNTSSRTTAQIHVVPDETNEIMIKVGEKRKAKHRDMDDNYACEDKEAEAKQQKLKVTRACFLCKKSHAACDNNRPCSR